MLSIHDVSLRRKAVCDKPDMEKMNIIGMLASVNERYNYNMIETLTKNSIQLPGDENDRVQFMLDRLDDICENDIRKAKPYTQLICEQFKLIKHAKNVANSIKGHLNSIKAKITGSNVKEQNKARQAVGMDKLERTSSGKMVSKDIRNHEDMKKQEKKKNKLNQENKEDEVKIECYQMMSECLDNYIAYDRIWKTHNRINERFNTRKIFEECNSDVSECVKEFCMLLDTYDVPFRAKVNICLENIAYEYDRNNKSVDKSELAEAVTRYFLINNSTFSEQMILEEANQKTMLDKMIRTCKRLGRSGNAVVVNIANKVLDVIGGVAKVTKEIAFTILDVLGVVIGGIIMLLGGVVVGGVLIAGAVGTILLLIGLAIGLITICIGVKIAVVISPGLRKKFNDKANEIIKKHGKKKNKKLNKALNKLSNAMDGVVSESYLMESFCECEYMSKSTDIEYVLKSNKFYSENDIRKAMGLLTEPEETRKFNYTLEDTILGIREDNKPLKKNSISDKMKNILNIAHKTPSMLKEKIKELYSNSPDEVIDETPNIFAILVDVCIIAGGFAINPVLGIVSGMTLWFIGMKANREQSEKYIKKFKKEKEKAEKRKLTGSAKERNDAYIAQLNKSIEKLEDYRNDLHTEEENEEREAKKSPNPTDDDSMDNFSFEDDDLKIESIVDIKLIDKAISILEGFRYNQVYDYIRRDDINPSALDYIVHEGCKSGVLNRQKLYPVLEEMANKNKRDMKKWNMYRAGMRTLREETYVGHDLYNRASVALDIYDIINEMSIGNHLTMLIDKVKRGASNLSDKEKIASRTLDTTLEKLRQSMENALTQENREAVIRGDILPSASRIIKLALVTGFAFLINPALSVIYLLGVFAMSRNIRQKERQLVLDEIDTELKVCKEYTEQAKEKRDMNAYRQCLQIEKKLLRQRDILNYKMKIAYRQDVQTNFEADKEK